MRRLQVIVQSREKIKIKIVFFFQTTGLLNGEIALQNYLENQRNQDEIASNEKVKICRNINPKFTFFNVTIFRNQMQHK